MIKVITHQRPRHMDDFLALCYLSSSCNGDIQVIEVHPQDPNLQIYKDNPEVYVIDVGGDYDPQKKNFDHHQDSNIDCSLFLIIRALPGILTEDDLESPILGYINTSDVQGPQDAQKKYDIKFDEVIADYIRLILDNIDYVTQGKKVIQILKECIDENINFSQFITRLYESFQDYLEPIYEKMKQQRRMEIHRIISISSIYTVKDHNALYVPEHTNFMGKIIREIEESNNIKISLVVAPNAMNNNHTSITRNSYYQKAVDEIDLQKVSQVLESIGIKKVFLHQNGFMLVVDGKSDELLGTILEVLNITIGG